MNAYISKWNAIQWSRSSGAMGIHIPHWPWWASWSLPTASSFFCIHYFEVIEHSYMQNNQCSCVYIQHWIPYAIYFQDLISISKIQYTHINTYTYIPMIMETLWDPRLQVVECEMSCLHQKRVMQPQYSCSDFTGVEAWTRVRLFCWKRGLEMVRIYDDYESGSKFKTWGTDLSLSVSTFQLGESNLRIHMHIRIAINIDQPTFGSTHGHVTTPDGWSKIIPKWLWSLILAGRFVDFFKENKGTFLHSNLGRFSNSTTLEPYLIPRRTQG